MRRCDWCRAPLPERTRSDKEVCDVVCRKRRWRFRQAIATGITPRVRRAVNQVGPAARFAYADPPYPGKAGYYPEGEEVDHRALIEALELRRWGSPSHRRYDRLPAPPLLDGWALSTSAAALRDVLTLCPPDVRVCVWRRQVRPTRSTRALSAWEPLLVVGGRPLDTSVPQVLTDELLTDDVVLDQVLDYRGRYDSFTGALIGMKPPEFAVWLFRQLGACSRDSFEDLFPGSGAVTRAWQEYVAQLERAVPRDVVDERDASRVATAA